jgi:hypothetical protein
MPGKEPSNTEILNELRDIGKRLGDLERWKISEDAYRAALAQVKRDEKEANHDAIAAEAITKRTELFKQAGIVLGLIAAILYAYAATKGITTP